MLCVATEQVGPHGLHRLLRARRLRGARQDGPRLRQRVDPALLVLRRPERRPVVEVGAPVPAAVPRELEDAAQPRRLVPVAEREIGALAGIADRGEVGQHADEEPSEPHALAAAFVADAVHAVVPVAAAHQRQPVLAVPAGVRDRADAVLEHARRLAATRAAAGRPPTAPRRAAGRRGTARSRRAPSRLPSATRRRRPRTAARAGRPSTACACRGRSADATSAGRRLRRTGAPRP